MTGASELEPRRSPFDERAGNERDQVLDGLRAIAVLAVIAGHAVNFRFAAESERYFASFRHLFGSAAVTGVEIFFLISGYVITRLLLREIQRSGSISFKGFYFRRTMRIFPPFGIYLLTIVVLSQSGYIDTKPADILSAALFTCNTGLFDCSWFVGHSWSLAVEEQFYLVWPLLLSLTPRRYVLPLLIALAAALIGISALRGEVAFANETSFLYIVIGALTACSLSLQRVIVSHVKSVVWLATAAMFIVASLYAPDDVLRITKPFLLATLVFGAGNVRMVGGLLKTWPFQTVGLCSYSVYLWQELFLAGPNAYLASTPPPLWLLPLVVWLSWRYVEKWGIASGRALSRRQTVLSEA